MVKNSLGSVKRDFDPAEHGGAPILGVAKPVIKAHGSSKAKAFKSAIRQAIQYVNSGVTEDIAADAKAFAERKKAAKKAEEASEDNK
jgi:glycerol-3-phosphate acyltransferase PlsX